MEFSNFRSLIAERFAQMNEEHALFVVAVDKDEMYNLYLDSFPHGSNEIYRERRVHDCSCCRSFIKGVGAVVSIKNNKITTLWGFDTGSPIYQPVCDAMDKYIKSKAVLDVFVSPFIIHGAFETFEELENGDVKRWAHLYGKVNPRFVQSRDIESVRAQYRDTRNVFKRSLDEISESAVSDVLDLIKDNNFYRGEEWYTTLEKFHTYQCGYAVCPDEDKDNFAWDKSVEAGPIIGRIRNHSIGTLLINLSAGMDLELAIKKYDHIVAPCNYKHPKATYSTRAAEAAKKTVAELGFTDSLKRRHATIDDITVNNILFANRDVLNRMSGETDIFDELIKSATVDPNKFRKVTEMPIKTFLDDILPNVKELSVLFENRHTGNLVSLIAPIVKDSPSMFKWNNNFGWTYNGNLTDSMKQRVKNAGGKIDGDLRFSIQWNESGHDNSDLDAHCIECGTSHIYFKNKVSRTGGNLDVDVRWPNGDIAVENITWPNINRMYPGEYTFYVHQYDGSTRNGFRAEIEFGGKIYSFDYSSPTRCGETIMVATVTLSRDGEFSIVPHLPAARVSSKEIWGVATNQFVPVTVVMNSPNYWDERGVGNRHWFFMLKDCVNPDEPNGFFNEFLKEELMQHKRVFELLSSKMRATPTDDQLSGIGFSSTQRNDIIVKYKTNDGEKVVRINF